MVFLRIGALAVLVTAGSALSTPASGQVVISTQLSGTVQEYAVRAGDTLTAIGARFGVDARVIASTNGQAWAAPLPIGRNLTIDNRHIVPATNSTDAAGVIAIAINVPQRMLFLMRDGTMVRAYPMAAGRPTWPTPIGSFQVLAKEAHPTWDVPLSIQEEMRSEGTPVVTQVPPGPDNPLGDHWIGLSIPGLGIHGTPAPSSIYSLASHGCIRLHPDDVVGLFADVTVGTLGVIVYEPVLLAVTPSGVFLEAHRDAYRQRRGATVDDVREAVRAAGRTEWEIDWPAVATTLAHREGIARRVSSH